MYRRVCRIKHMLTLLVVLSLLSACSSLPWDTIDVARSTDAPSQTNDTISPSAVEATEQEVTVSNAVDGAYAPAEQRVKSALYPGTDRFVGQNADNTELRRHETEEDVTLNFENTDLREVVNIILGDLLKVNYVIDPAVRGGVSMQTGRPLSRDLLMPTLETLLRMNGATIVIDRGGMHHVVPKAKAVSGMSTPQLTDATAALPNGYSIQIVPLKFISVGEMAKILEPIAGDGSVVRVDTRRNLLLLAGDRKELRYLLETIDIFDVDWLAGLSVGFFALNHADVEDVMKDLNGILQGESGGFLDGMVKIVPIASANGVLVVTPRSRYLNEVEKWIGRLDQLGAQDDSEQRLNVYRVKNGDAEILAGLLNELLAGDGKKEQKKATIAPGLIAKKVEVAGDKSNKDKAGTAAKPKSVATSGGVSGISDLSGSIRIVADTEKNSLLIMSTAKDYVKLLSVLHSLDIVPLQVHVEATIVEITLAGDLKYGLQWFFKTHHGSKSGIGSLDGSLDSSSASGLGGLFPGFNWSIIDSADQVRAVLGAFAGDAAVKVLSAPSVMVLDNHEATIQVGDQVPVATQQQQSTGTTSTVINSIQYRDTGVLLKVKPRVNPGGLVSMELSQEVSSVSKTDSSNLDSPTIQTRKIATTVAINSGESVVLGGLISEEESNGKSGVPGLYRLPVVGALFGETTNTSRRKELVVVLTPKVIASNRDAREISADYRARLRGLSGVHFGTPIEGM